MTTTTPKSLDRFLGNAGLTADQNQSISDLIDAFGYAYTDWATSGTEFFAAGVYELDLDQEAAEHLGKAKVSVDYKDIHAALVKLATGEVFIAPDLARQAVGYLANPADCDLDSEIADCAIQTAVFGDVIFG